jgi:YD repeat-containing protein
LRYYVRMRFETLTRNKKFLLATALTFVLAGASANKALSVTAADGTEKRIYEVSIDDQPAGNYQLKIVTHGNKIDVTSDCEVTHRVLVFHYHYKYHGHEQWTGKKVTAFESQSDDNGKRCSISALSSADGIELKVNGKVRNIDGDTLTSSYWHLPVTPFDKIGGKYLEVDSGRTFTAEMSRLGEEPIKIGDRSENCFHYKLNGGDETNLWYDSEDRLVRQTSNDSGHRTAVQLKSIDR